MFTGLIQAVSPVLEIQAGRLRVEVPENWSSDPLQVGESVCVNGCCLTTLSAGELVFELSPETYARTAFGGMKAGALVNLERALRPMDRLGGHIVQGHVDGLGSVVSVQDHGDHTEIHFEVPIEFDKYLIDKGSIAIDGISLTVVAPEGGLFSVWVVPHTLENTNLRSAAPGTQVHVEFDVLAKHLEKLYAGRDWIMIQDAPPVDIPVN